MNTGYSKSLRELINLLPESNSEISNNKSPYDAFEEGYARGLSMRERNVEEALFSLPDRINEVNRSCEAAYLKGCEIGAKVRNSSLFSEQCFNGNIPLPPIKKYKGIDRTPFQIYKINDNYIVSVSHGTLSEFDIIARYWQYDYNSSSWKKSRQPKHIHWAVDLLIKNEYNRRLINMFITKLIDDWNDETIIKQIETQEELLDFLNPAKLLKYVFVEASKYSGFDLHGEYTMELLIILSRLLMVQERTNRSDAYMIKKLLDDFNNSQIDFFDVVNTATFKH